MFDSDVFLALCYPPKTTLTFGLFGSVLTGFPTAHLHGRFFVFDGPADMAGDWI